MNIRKITLQHRALFVLCLLLGFGLGASAQVSSVVTLRFSNPEYNVEKDNYTVDVEMKAIGNAQELFGMNIRFFYDAAALEFQAVEGFYPGYELLGEEQPKVYTGNADSGPVMFGFEESAAYVNGAMQLMEGMQAMKIPKNEWTKAFSLRFRIAEGVENGSFLCPSLVWDLKAYKEEGLFRGDNGVRLTLVEDKPYTREVSTPCVIQSLPFNWAYYQTDDEMPFGYVVEEQCFLVGEAVTATQEADEAGYVLHQNYPNPFNGETQIEFELPRSEEAILTFYDARGREIGTVQGDYPAGRNLLKIKQEDLIPQGGVLFYRLRTAGFTSVALKMTAIDR